MLPPADAETPGQPGDRSRPPLLATATPAAVTALAGAAPAGAAPAGAAGANRPTITDPAAPTAATTSAHPDPAASGIATSTPATTRTEMNQIRTASNRAAILRNQPRTVDAGTPNTTAIRRCPAPPALATTAAQINSAAYPLRSSNDTGSNTCVTEQSPHRARRGRTRPPHPTTDRARA